MHTERCRPVCKQRGHQHGSFTSRQDLLDKLIGFIADYDRTAKPFRWTYAADPLVAA